MTPELAVVLFFALLWGPTVLWLLYRALRGPDGRVPESFTRAAETRQGTLVEPGAPAPLDYWVCEACRSMNLRGAKRCYSCKAAKVVEQPPAPAALPDTQPGGLGWIPVMDADLGRSSGTAAAATLTAAITVAGDPAPDAAVPVPELAAGAATSTPSAAPVCPFLGFKEDPATRCSYPDPRNVCHARSERGGVPFPLPRRLISGTGGGTRSQVISPEDQATLCLTSEHEQCARYPALHVLAGTR